jgi:competence protein ComGF
VWIVLDCFKLSFYVSEHSGASIISAISTIASIASIATIATIATVATVATVATIATISTISCSEFQIFEFEIRHLRSANDLSARGIATIMLQPVK